MGLACENYITDLVTDQSIDVRLFYYAVSIDITGADKAAGVHCNAANPGGFICVHLLTDTPAASRTPVHMYHSHPRLFPNPSIANQNLSHCVNAVCNGSCIQPPLTLSEPPAHPAAHEVGSRCNQRIGAAAVRSRFLEPRHKFRRELLLYILVTLHTPERAGPVSHTPRDSRGKPILIIPAPASRVVALPKIITLTDNSMSNVKRCRQLLCCAER